jgi:thiamine kinase-like enzyme
MSAENPLKQSLQDIEKSNRSVKKFDEDIAKRIAETGTWRSRHGEERHQLFTKQLDERTGLKGKEREDVEERHLNELVDLHKRQQKEKEEGVSDQ